MTPSKYATEWAAAVERTKRFGLDVPTHQVEPERRYLTDQRHAEFPSVVLRGLGDLDFPDVVAQCLSIHYRLVPVLEEWLGCPVLYTIGWVDDGTDTGMFKFDDAFVADKLKNGHTGSTANIHAWLTLPSMEVIDVALVTTLAVLKGWREGHGAVLAKHADDITGMAYKPMLIGPDFLRKTDLLVERGVYTR
jgi:hypothetical protein